MESSKSPVEETQTPARNYLFPFKGYYATPVILYLNLLVFAAMIIAGANPMEPGIDIMLKWGANFRPLTLHGEWWRLIASSFLHFGILHLLLNMSALIYMGSILEPVTGTTRFSVVYMLSALGSSLASLYWHSYTAGAGASGAIFGLFGTYAALLHKGLPEYDNRKKKLVQVLLLIAINLVASHFFQFDNPGHIGGLITGYFAGRIYFETLYDRYNRPLFLKTTTGLVIGFAVLGLITFNTIVDQVPIYKQKMERFSILEKSALEVYSLVQYNDVDKERLLYEINDRGIYYWNEAKKVLDEIETLDLPESIKQNNLHLKKYCTLRIKTYELTHRSIAEDTRKYDEQILKYNKEIEQMILKRDQGSIQ